jgi:tRNA nucleotidyltransferase (CCA-adding enzyme)
MRADKEKTAKAVFERVLGTIKPSRKELKESVRSINMLMERLRKVMPRDIEARVVGSVVRGTQLRGDSDIDIFLLFKKTLSRERITRDGTEYAKRIVRGKGERYEIKYAEHPYVRVYLDDLGVRADIVPAFKIDNIEDMGTAVDRSPMHADFMSKHLSERQRDEVRLLKRLLDVHDIYGAEIAIGGFSGYLCELLILHYGSLVKLLDAAAAFRLPLVLAPKGKAIKDGADLAKKFNSQFVVLDPIDPNRNVAAGVSIESLARFSIIAREFVAKPSIRSFHVRNPAPEDSGRLIKAFIKKSGLDLFVLETALPDKSEDVLWPQLRKVADFIRGHIEKSGFQVYSAIPIVHHGRGLIVFIAPRLTLKTRLLKGPSAFMGNAQVEYARNHMRALGTTVIGESVCVIDDNKYASVGEALHDIVKGKVMNRHKDIRVRGSAVFKNRVPKGCAGVVYYELMKRMRI